MSGACELLIERISLNQYTELFSAELVNALSAARLLDDEFFMTDLILAESYLTLRILTEPQTEYPNLTRFRELSTCLATKEEGNMKYREYIGSLASAAVRSGTRFSRWFEQTETEDFEVDLLAAAIIINRPNLAERLAPAIDAVGYRHIAIGNPLELAICRGQLDTFELLISRLQPQPGREEFEKISELLRTACREGQAEIVDFVLNAAWSPYKYDGDFYIGSRHLMLYRHLKTPSIQVFEKIMAKRDRTHVANELSKHVLGRLINQAATSGHKEMVAHLLALESQLNMDMFDKDSNDRFSLAASKGGCAEIVEMLLRCGAQIHHSELEEAAQNGHSEVVKLLLEHGADIHCTSAKNALSVAAKGGHFATVRIILDHGINANQGTPPPITQAVESEHVQIFEILVGRGADVNIPEIGAEAVKRAQDSGLHSMLALLKENMRQDRWEQILGANQDSIKVV